MRGDILNDEENVDDQEIFEFTESYFRIAPTNIDDYTKNKLLNMQQENFISQINIGINDKRTDEIYQKNTIDDKESDERDHISKIYEEKILEDIEIMKLQNLSSKKIYIYLEKKSDKIHSKDMSDNMHSYKREQINKTD